MLIKGGFQVPEIPFVELSGRAGATEPLHTGPIALNVGVVDATVMVIQAGANAGLPQRSSTDPDAFVRHTW